MTWTRLAVISLTTDAPDTQATVGRLLKNQTDIGNAIKPYYGAAAGKQLTALLREHILIAADLIAAAKKGDQAGVASQQARWTANADEIATLLSNANPRSWKLGAMKAMMRDHLRLTTDEVVARLQENWAADVRAYDRIHRQILHMADMLSTGTRRAVPEPLPLDVDAPSRHRPEVIAVPRGGRVRCRGKRSLAGDTNETCGRKSIRNEEQEVVSWRRDQLVHAGFPLPLATRLARDPRYDLHALIELVERGCPPELAARILAPLEESEAA